MSSTIFISYRREEDAGFAGRLFDRLERTFRHQLFMDVDSIALGQDFVSILDSRVAECDVLLALIGRGWLTVTDAAGRRRLNNPDDFVRIEIAAGLARGKRIIPVLINDVPMPQAEELPEELKPLVRRQALRLGHERFKTDTAQLIRALKQALAEAEKGRQEEEARTKAREEQQCQDELQRQRGAATKVLILGFGGSGAHILTFLKELAVVKYGNKPEWLQFPLFDTIRDWKPGATVRVGGRSEETIAHARTREGGMSLDPAEYFQLRDGAVATKVCLRISDDRQRSIRYPHLHWLNVAWLRQNISGGGLNIAEGAAQQRQIGRFALFQNVETLRPLLASSLAKMERYAGGAILNVWIVGSSAGGTGAGCLLDAAYLIRLAAPRPDKLRVSAVIVLPDVYRGVESVSAVRAYSLFRELERLQAQDCE